MFIERFISYIEFEKRYSKLTILAYKEDLHTFNQFLKNEFNILEIESADANQIRSYLMHLNLNKQSERSINRKIATLKSFYKFLTKNNFIEQNPCDKIKTLKTSKKLPVFVQEKEIITLLDNLQFENTFIGLRDKLIIELFYGTGIRLSELISIKETDINLDANQLKVIGKGNKERIIPINRELKNTIQSYLLLKKNQNLDNVSSYLVVTDTMKKTYQMFIFRVVRKYLSHVTNNEKKSPHTLRHSFATHLLNKGADLNAIKELLGHTSLAATQVYTHNSIEKLKNIFEKAHPKA
ncbi:MAG: tyrosine-type recombinase/integrase [Cytophagales bacterium]